MINTQNQLKDPETTVGEALRKTINAIEGDSITLKALLELVGEQGMLLFCTILTIPFLVPVSIPGVSTVFGLVIILIGIGVTFNRLPWLPERLMRREIKREHLAPALEKGIELFTKLERWLKPRLTSLTTGVVVNRINGAALTFSGILLIFPFGFIPFSNTFPGYAILFFAVGMMQRDGYFIVLGYIAMIITVLYFGVLIGGVLLAGGTLIFSS
jgi:hypothetical protein